MLSKRWGIDVEISVSNDDALSRLAGEYDVTIQTSVGPTGHACGLHLLDALAVGR